MSTTATTLRPPNSRRSTDPPVAATDNDGDLPLDVLYEILLRLPRRALCRFHAVCRSWRSLLCHPEFLAAARNPGLLLAIAIEGRSSRNKVHVLDMESGAAVKDVTLAAKGDGEARAMSDDCMACVVGRHNRLRLVDIHSGAISLLPDGAASPGSTVLAGVVGYVASTGEHKVLAVAGSLSSQMGRACKIFTLGKGTSNGWRDAGSPPLSVWLKSRSVAVVNGVAYFASQCMSQSIRSKERCVHKRCVHQIMGFDFNNEMWRPATPSLEFTASSPSICLAKLEGHLVVGHPDGHTSIDLWVLVDLDRSLWSKRYTMTMPCYQNSHLPLHIYEYFEKPLAVLDDGRIVVWMQLRRGMMLRIYDPRTKTFRDGVRVEPYRSRICVFTWRLLSSGQRDALDLAAERLLLGRRLHQTGATSSTEGPNKKRPASDLS